MNLTDARSISVTALFALVFVAAAHTAGQAEETNLYWGDTHLHTYNSADAYLLMNRTVSPDDSYRFAKGQPIIHPSSRAKIQLQTPLDFLVVADHAGALGIIRAMIEGDPRIANTPFGKQINEAAARGEEAQAFADLVGSATVARREGDSVPSSLMDPESMRGAQTVIISTWQETIAAAERHNDPGNFTSLIGWEWTSMPGGANLHRVVFMKDGGDIAKKFIPYSVIQSSAPEDLWNWLERTAERTGASFIAIPHNSNLSIGQMFDEVDIEGRPITEAYARTRMRWEPVAEATQVKGDSETHPTLSPTDEFADYEYYKFLLGGDKQMPKQAKAGSYVRTALMRGLEIEEKVGVNPFKFGLIGSTDFHTGASTVEEDNYWGKFGASGMPETKGTGAINSSRGYDMGSAGLAAVWAEENTREEIYNAFQRKEVYSTTGPRMQVRFFGGWKFDKKDLKASSIAKVGYKKGVPMGSDLTRAPKGKSPSFLIRAVKDPVGANLDRVQVIKGWVGKDGKAEEKIFNVALSDGRKEKKGKVKAVGNTVDLKTAEYTNTIGDAQLLAVWTDPEFDADQRAFYYVRVLQIPTPRHTLYDAVAMQTDPPEGYDTTIQERAYTSPIWYTPKD